MLTKEGLRATLEAAGRSHHEYETTYLKGVRDEQWPGYYAAFTLGRLSDLAITPSRLTRLLEDVDAEDWAEAAAEAVLAELASARRSAQPG